MAVKTITFEHPENGYKESFRPDNAWLCTLLAAPIYFAIKGSWTHTVASLMLALCTMGASNILYAFYARRILCNHYQRKGWREAVKGAAA